MSENSVVTKHTSEANSTKKRLPDSGKTPMTAISLFDAMKQNGVPDKERSAFLFSYLQSKARREGIPLHGTLELTPHCNLDCKMCYVHLSQKQYPESSLLSVETWISLIDEARKKGLMSISLSGGECLTYPGFDDVYMHLYQHGIRTSVLTNGLLLDDQRISFFKRYPPYRIQITLYGRDEEEYESVTGRRVYRQIMEHLSRLKESGLHAGISITPNLYMNPDIRTLLETAQKTGFPWQVNCSLLVPRNETGRKGCDLTQDHYVDINRIMLEVQGRTLYRTDPQSLPKPNRKVPPEPYKGIRCGAGRSTFTITYDGRMCPCPGLINMTTSPLTEGFQTAWKKLNRMAEEYPVPGECMECSYAKQCILCSAHHQHAPAGHCDQRICERTVKLAAAGILRSPADTEPCEECISAGGK